jgi:hypothetical protein
VIVENEDKAAGFPFVLKQDRTGLGFELGELGYKGLVQIRASLVA